MRRHMEIARYVTSFRWLVSASRRAGAPAAMPQSASGPDMIDDRRRVERQHWLAKSADDGVLSGRRSFGACLEQHQRRLSIADSAAMWIGRRRRGRPRGWRRGREISRSSCSARRSSGSRSSSPRRPAGRRRASRPGWNSVSSCSASSAPTPAEGSVESAGCTSLVEDAQHDVDDEQRGEDGHRRCPAPAGTRLLPACSRIEAGTLGARRRDRWRRCPGHAHAGRQLERDRRGRNCWKWLTRSRPRSARPLNA